MKSIKSVEDNLYSLFESFITGALTDVQFTDNLKRLCKGKGGKNYWWRFFANDTGANDGASVANSLSSNRNRSYVFECMQIALENKSLVVLYS